MLDLEIAQTSLDLVVEDRTEQHAWVIEDGLGGYATELHSRSFFFFVTQLRALHDENQLNPSNMRVLI